jgi:hypothetical protein
MSKITVNETVTRSVSFENSQVDIQTALDRCFLFLEEERFEEAHVIIEQILNIEPNNTDAHVANFLYQFKLSCAEDVVQNFKNCIAYKNSVFYKRIKRGAQTELSKKLDFCLGRAGEQLEKFRIEEERLLIEKEIHKDCSYSVVLFVVSSALGIYCSIIAVFSNSSEIKVLAFLGTIIFSVFAILLNFDIIKKRKKLHDWHERL